MVHIRPGDRAGKPCYEVFECKTDTSIKELKQMVRHACELEHYELKAPFAEVDTTQVEEFGNTSGGCSVPWDTQVAHLHISLRLLLNRRTLHTAFDWSAAMQELVFNEERCENDKCLADYGVNMEFIKQVGSQMSVVAKLSRIMCCPPFTSGCTSASSTQHGEAQHDSTHTSAWNHSKSVWMHVRILALLK